MPVSHSRQPITPNAATLVVTMSATDGDRRLRITGESDAVTSNADSVIPSPPALALPPELEGLVDGEIERWTALVQNGHARAVGEVLYRALFHGELEQHLETMLDTHDRRIELRLDTAAAPSATPLPWELLWSPRRESYLVRGGRVSLTRLATSRHDRAQIEPVALPLRVLVVVSSPKDLDALDGEAELQTLRDAFLVLRNAKVEVRQVRPIRAEIEQAVRTSQWHVLHFSGHGGFENDEGFLALERADRTSHHISAGDLSAMLRGGGLRLVVLSACATGSASTKLEFGGLAQRLTADGIPAVVAMQRPVTEVAARSFTQGFYRSLAAGATIEAATADARTMIADSAAALVADEWSTPILRVTGPISVLVDPSKRSNTLADRVKETSGPIRGILSVHGHGDILVEQILEALHGACQLDVWEDDDDIEHLDERIQRFDFALAVFAPELLSNNRSTPPARTQNSLLLRLGALRAYLGAGRVWTLVDSDFEAPSGRLEIGVETVTLDGRNTLDNKTALTNLRHDIELLGKRHSMHQEAGALHRAINAITFPHYDDVNSTVLRFVSHKVPEAFDDLDQVFAFFDQWYWEYVTPTLSAGEWASYRIAFAYSLGHGFSLNGILSNAALRDGDLDGNAIDCQYVIGWSNKGAVRAASWRLGRGIPGTRQHPSHTASSFDTLTTLDRPNLQDGQANDGNYLIEEERSLFVTPVLLSTRLGRASLGCIAVSSSDSIPIPEDLQDRVKMLALLLGVLLRGFSTEWEIDSSPIDAVPGSRSIDPAFRNRVVKLRRVIASYFETGFVASKLHVPNGERLDYDGPRDT